MTLAKAFRAPPASQDRATEASPGAAKSVSAIRSVSTGAGQPWAEHLRRRDAIQAVRDRFYAEWRRINAEMEAEIDRIKWEGW